MADDDHAAGTEIAVAAQEKSDSGVGRSPRGIALIAGLTATVAVGSLCGWLGTRAYHSAQITEDNAVFVQVARQGVINLTSVDHAEVERDVERILDSATGTFYDDFSSRAQPFIEVVEKAQSTSEGTVLDAGLESVSDNEAQVLVAVRVTTVMADGTEQQPKSWRMRISVQRMGEDVKVSNVAFVP